MTADKTRELAERFVSRMTWPSMHWRTQSLDLEAAMALAKVAVDSLDLDHFPRVQGECPICGLKSLFLGAGGYVTCSSLSCSKPEAASMALGVTFPQAVDQ